MVWLLLLLAKISFLILFDKYVTKRIAYEYSQQKSYNCKMKTILVKRTLSRTRRLSKGCFLGAFTAINAFLHSDPPVLHINDLFHM